MSAMTLLAWRSISENRLRSILSMAAVSLGVAVMISGSLITEAVRKGILQTDEIRAIMEGLIAMLDPAMLFVGLAVMLASGFLIFNTFGMAITQRRQQIGALRALGMTRQQVMRVILAEALLLSAAGVILGLLLSIALGSSLVALMKQLTGELLAFGDASPTLPIMILAAVMGLVITMASVMIPARRAARVAPLDALREPQAAGATQVARWRILLGGGLLLTVLGIDVLAPPGAWAIYPVDVTLTGLFVLAWLVGVNLLLPGLIGLGAAVGRRAIPGAVGRLISDNLERARGRVTLTVTTLAFALLMLVGLTGFLEFFLSHGFSATMQEAADQDAAFVSRLELTSGGGWGTILARELDSIMLSDDEISAIVETAEGRATVAAIYSTVVPETSLLGTAYFSYVIDPVAVRDAGTTVWTFTEGDWETAMPIMQDGCGLLVAPSVAVRLGATIGDTVTITGLDGPLDCILAGIGSSPAGGSIISGTVQDQVTDLGAIMMFVVPKVGVDSDALYADMEPMMAIYPEININPVALYIDTLDEATGMISVSLNAMLVLAMLAAAFGVLNTVTMNIEERRREIGLLRAVGTTRKQTRRVIVGEAVLLGVIGGTVGFLAGLGVVVVIVMTYGFNSFGVELDLWATVGKSLQPALLTGVVGLIAAPVIAALAAWMPTRNILKSEPVTLIPKNR